MADLLLIAITILLGLILIGIRQLVTKAEEQAHLFHGHLEKINDQLRDIRTRLRDNDYMTDQERERDAGMREAGIFDEAPDLD